MKAALLFLVASSTLILAKEDKIGFVYELVRHGARAPLQQEPEGFFHVKAGLLTAQGMRQRYLMGKLNKARYIDKHQLIDSDYNPSQLYIQSTDVLRTIQSSYSEMLGLFPPKDNGQLTLTAGEQQSLKEGKGMPPITIRVSPSLKEQLGGRSIIDNYVQIPVFTYLEKSINDDINYYGCPYTDQYNSYHFPRNDTYYNVSEYILPVIRDPVGVAYNLTVDQRYNLTYNNFYDYTDALIAENFEGDPRRFNFSQEEWEFVRLTQKYALTVTFSEYARNLFITKQFRRPMQVMKDRVAQILANDTNRDTLRWLIYSAHDLQIANVLLWIKPVDHDFSDVPYVTSMFFELHYDEECVATTKDNSCFTVQILHSGSPLKFDTCITANEAAGKKTMKCTYDDFVKHIESVSFQGDVIAECKKSWTPPSINESE